jgi:hypothetical protein
VRPLEADKQRLADAEQRLSAAVVEAQGWREAAEAEFAGKNRLAAAAAALQQQLTAAEQRLSATEQRLTAVTADKNRVAATAMALEEQLTAAAADKNRVAAAAAAFQQQLTAGEQRLSATVRRLTAAEGDRDRAVADSRRLQRRVDEVEQQLATQMRAFVWLFARPSTVSEVGGRRRTGTIIAVETDGSGLQVLVVKGSKQETLNLSAADFASGWQFLEGEFRGLEMMTTRTGSRAGQGSIATGPGEANP